jgi:hypothetical protein
VWVYVAFIDLGEPKRGAHNRGDYKLGSVMNVFFWSRESILV